MTENEAIEELKYDCNEIGKAIPCDTSWGESFENAYAMAINALEEVQHWHTSVINPKIKNVFANSSTQICQNCDHKDEYIEELEAEIEQYRAIGTPEELQDMKNNYFEALSDWRQYRKIGTLEECRAAVEKQTAKRALHQGCYDKNGEWHEWNGINGKPYELCPSCRVNLCCETSLDIKPKYCKNCGQKLDWSDKK